jgi:hypothetical protein
MNSVSIDCPLLRIAFSLAIMFFLNALEVLKCSSLRAVFTSGNRRSEVTQGQMNTVRGWFASCHNSPGSPSFS